MNNQQTLSIDLTKEEDAFKFVTNHFFTKVYETGLPGKRLIYASHPACEYNEHYIQQHGIVVHLKPERNSLRRLDYSSKCQSLAKNRYKTK